MQTSRGTPWPRLRVPQRQPPDEEAHRQGVPRDAGPAGAADPRTARSTTTSCRTRTPARTPPEVRYLRERPRAPRPARPPARKVVPGPPAAVREALRGAPQGLGTQDDRHHHGVRPAVKDSPAGQGDRPALGPVVPTRPAPSAWSPFPHRRPLLPAGQTYDPVDRDQLLYSQEAEGRSDPQRGIRRRVHWPPSPPPRRRTRPTASREIPFYIIYSMFGWREAQATSSGRSPTSWDAASSSCATAGAPPMTGEGLQHADGHSHLIAPPTGGDRYDPAFAYEVAVIVREGLRRMYGPEPRTSSTT
ncbi:hypothetical protein [Streptomyces thioluteus]|uniref:hypothetical protein n=1 Tax=Streptomyces thioluteus TaxID=66431 RepID=UPI0031F15A8D